MLIWLMHPQQQMANNNLRRKLYVASCMLFLYVVFCFTQPQFCCCSTRHLLRPKGKVQKLFLLQTCHFLLKEKTCKYGIIVVFKYAKVWSCSYTSSNVSAGLFRIEFFKNAGEVVDVRLATDQEGNFRGFGHVEFASAEDAKKVMIFICVFTVTVKVCIPAVVFFTLFH